MTDETANAPAEPAAPEAESAHPAPPEPNESAREAIARSLADWPEEGHGAEEPSAPEPSVETKPDDGQPPRGPDGKFLPRDKPEGETEAKPAEEPAKPEPADEFSEPPQGISPEAQAAWKAAPPELRSEVARRMGEMEKGLQEHQQRWEPLKELDQLCRQHKTTIDQAMRQYMAYEQAIQKDPVKGLEMACADLGVDFRKVAAEVAGQKPDEALTQYSGQLRAAMQKIGELEQQLQGVNQTIRGDKEAATLRQVEQFAADHPRFDELAPTIAKLIGSGLTSDLSEAYDMAERLNPAPVTAPDPAAQTRPAETPPAQTRPASLSVAGAPDSGSDPARRKPASSAREAVQRAFASHQ